ncbi:TonB-dependent receptor [Ideonella livida]|uniref:TonB-dependent siderophore receptor n=1 Tax=Ideonella livida TaxID=2707176 RepID=A0A7C9TM64_9BURK|nr:TonB-dependent siderophore receptor [Ideonella livida]NDY94040.1 TonB-dependent siderophore receptor [Ideonella livida]
MTSPRPNRRPLPRVAASTLLPLGALAAGFAHAQATPADAPTAVLPTVRVTATAETEQGKDTLKPATTRIGKGTQAVKDIPQSVTVLTERLMNDRNLDDFKEVLRSTAGVTFLAGETGEEDVRLRGFSLQQAGDIYIDGMRDSPVIERDTFNYDRVEVLKGSASMLFGRGSTGGVVNQVSKQPFAMDQHEVALTVGSGNDKRLTGDFNLGMGENAGLRVNAMVQQADNWGASVDKKGIAPTYRWGIGTTDEFSVGLYHLTYDNRPNYNHPWFLSDTRTVGSSTVAVGEIQPVLAAKNYYGLASDYHQGHNTQLTLGHVHRFGDGGELSTRVRHGTYERDILVSAIRWGTTNGATTTASNVSDATLLSRSPKGRYAESDITSLQSDYSRKFAAAGLEHELLAGLDVVDEDAQRINSYTTGLTYPSTTVGTPNDGASVADTRADPKLNSFQARNLGVYVQDTLSLTPQWKLLAGLRMDLFKARYQTAETTAANGTVTPATSFERTDRLWSPRLGAMFQPDAASNYYFSYGTSYNTSGDTYQYAVGSPSSRVANTPAEKSRNIELGAKWDLFSQRALLGLALFRSEKYNERNTDPDTAATQELLSGRRHATGLELNLAGRVTPAWEVFYNHTWIPSARIDESNVALNATSTGAQVEGDRPGLTPKHSASLWSTYKLSPQWRVGGGLNYSGEQNPEGSRHVIAPAFTTVDAMAEYTFSERYSAKLNVSNLTDELYADALYRGFYTPGAPRKVQLTVKGTFY